MPEPLSGARLQPVCEGSAAKALRKLRFVQCGREITTSAFRRNLMRRRCAQHEGYNTSRRFR